MAATLSGAQISTQLTDQLGAVLPSDGRRPREAGEPVRGTDGVGVAHGHAGGSHPLGLELAFVSQWIEIRSLDQRRRKIRVARGPQGRDQRVVGGEPVGTEVVLEEDVDAGSAENRRVGVLNDGRLAQGRIDAGIHQRLVCDRWPALVPDDLTDDRRQVSSGAVTAHGKARTVAAPRAGDFGATPANAGQVLADDRPAAEAVEGRREDPWCAGACDSCPRRADGPAGWRFA